MPYLGQYSGEKERVDKQRKREAQAKDKRDQDKAPVGKQHEDSDWAQSKRTDKEVSDKLIKTHNATRETI